MNVIELLDRDAAPDAWHDVRNPGGYEWWYFDAHDTATDTQIVAILMQGFIFHPGYLRKAYAYLKAPNKTLPAVANDYPCAYLVVYEKGKLTQQFITQYRPADFAAASDEVDVAMGPNRLTQQNGNYELTLRGTPWKLTGRGPQTLVDQSLAARLSFTPSFNVEPEQRTFLSREMTNAEHRWVIASPACRVHGTITLDGPAAKEWKIDGVGYHDHNYGTGPIGPGLSRWIWGRVLAHDASRVLTFHHALPSDAKLSPETHVTLTSGEGVVELPGESLTLDWHGSTKLRLRYPRRIEVAGHAVLHSPRVVDASPFYLRVVYESDFGRALCEIAVPSRLRWPVLGRMIEMSIDKRAVVSG
jgi:carotenoid 1,2-hydratase